MTRRNLGLGAIAVLVVGAILWGLRRPPVDRAATGPVVRNPQVRTYVGTIPDSVRQEDPESPLPTVVPPPSPNERITLVVRDCWNGEPVPGFAFKGTTCDSGGRIETTRASVDSLQTEDPLWRIARPRPDVALLDGGDLWVYRRVPLRVRLRSGTEGAILDPATASVEAKAPTSPPVEGADLHSYRGWPREEAGRTGTGGTRIPYDEESRTFQGLIPRLPDVGVLAEAPGWRRSSTIVACPPHPVDFNEVELVLLRRANVRGRILANEGPPSRPLTVVAYTVNRTTLAGMREFSVQRQINLITREKVVSVSKSRATTDGEGRFDIELKEDGDTVLVVWDPEFAPIFHPLGSPLDDVEGVSMNLKPPEAHGSVRLLVDGKPLSHHQLYLSDLTLRDVQPAVMIPIDQDGKVLARWFAMGREYGLGFQGPMAKDVKDRFLVWNGQTEVELTTLPLATDVLSR
jgi:hypothetical protein